jgi:hypothetical protein
MVAWRSAWASGRLGDPTVIGDAGRGPRHIVEWLERVLEVVVDGHAAVDLKARIGHRGPDAGERSQQAVQPAERRAGVAQRRRTHLGGQDRAAAEQVGEGRADGIAQDADARRIEPEDLAETFGLPLTTVLASHLVLEGVS